MARVRQKKKAYRVFLSHATADKWIAMQVDKMIQGLGVATFRDDRDIETGDKIPDEIREQMEACREMLVLWTPNAVSSDWVRGEIFMAFALKLHIVAIRHTTDVASLPPCIKSELSPELTELLVNRYLEDLKARVARFQGDIT